jgi:cytochrome c biogenesis protein CcmG, thiol:disulfide interchange protein DsbE
MKITSILFLTAIFWASCSNGKNEKNISSTKDSIASKEFYKNGTAKIMTKNEYDSFTKNISLKNIGKEMQTFSEIESEVQNGDSTIYTFELHGKIKNTNLIGKSLPDFNFKDLNGKYVKLSELIGKPIIINLWFKECIPCIAEMPTLNSIKEKYSKTDIQFLSMTYESKKEVEKFIKTNEINFRIIPEVGKYCESLASNFPQSIFVNREGIITDIQNGMTSIYDKKLKMKSEKMDETEFISSLEKIK